IFIFICPLRALSKSGLTPAEPKLKRLSSGVWNCLQISEKEQKMLASLAGKNLLSIRHKIIHNNSSNLNA
ncbi:MAG: hypothetical protein QXF85_02350, partial [Candidatus Micrarchaeaceae archaeon]